MSMEIFTTVIAILTFPIDPLSHVWTYDVLLWIYENLLGHILLTAIVTITGLATLNYYYFKVETRLEMFPESYAYQFATNLLKRKDSGILHFFKESFDHVYATTKRTTFVAYLPFLPTYIFVNDPRDIEYVLKTNFENYEKGPQFYIRMNDLLGKGIFNSDGEVWYRHRKTSVKLFSLNIFRNAVMYQFNEHVSKVTDIIHKSARKSFDFQDLMARFTLDTIGKIAFGYDIGSLLNPMVTFAKDFDYIQYQCAESFIDPLWQVKRYTTYDGYKYFASVRRLNDMAYSIIQQRRQAEKREISQGNNSSIDMIGKDGQPVSETILASLDLLQLYFSRQDTDGELDDVQLRDIVMNFLLAGRDTTANALSWAMYRLCIHPHLQEVVRAEVLSLIRSAKSSPKKNTEDDLLDANGNLTYNGLANLKYLEAFLMEVIRLHPSVPKEVKFARGDDVLPDKTTVNKGDCICFCPWVMGHDERLWQNAEEFLPERFYNKPKPSPFLYTAFFAGPRTCLGQNMSLLEMKCCLAKLLTQFEFTIQEDPTKVTYQNSVTHPIQGGLKISAKPMKFM